MKKFIKVFSLILIVVMSFSGVGVYANNIVFVEELDVEFEEKLSEEWSDEDSSTDEIMPMNATGCGMTSSQAKKAAAALGYTQVAGEYSHGQPVFYNSKNVPHYITADTDGHIGGVWKGANSIKDLGSKSTRLGTYDADLNWIGD